MGLSAAVAAALPGDLYYLRAGTYSGSLTLSRAGTNANPIVWRNYPGERATIQKTSGIGVEITGADNWLWGLEIIGSTTVSGPVVNMSAPGAHVINCVIRDNIADVGIGSWRYPRQVVYGNIVYNNLYGIYGQNDYDAHGYKYVVDNLWLDPLKYNFHVYGENSEITGFHVQRNVWRGGEFVWWGGSSTPPASRNNIVLGNYSYRVNSLIIGSAALGGGAPNSPWQGEFRNNYLVQDQTSRVLQLNLWVPGSGTSPAKPGANIITGNEIYVKGGLNAGHIRLVSVGYLNGIPTDLTRPLDPADRFDGNTYGTDAGLSLLAQVYANGVSVSSTTIAGWRNELTSRGGTNYELNSVVTGLPTANKVVLQSNDYETGRANLAIYKWAGGTHVTVDMSPTVPVGSSYKIMNATDPFGPSLLQGTYTGPISVPVSGLFGSFLVTWIQ